MFFFNDEALNAPLKKIVISVKSGKNLTPSLIRDLLGTVKRENAAMGVFMTLAEPTKGMTQEATTAGVNISPFSKERFPAVQLVTINQILNGRKPRLPQDYSLEATFKNNRPAIQGQGRQASCRFQSPGRGRLLQAQRVALTRDAPLLSKGPLCPT
jgi:site-specific DNA-methyltransferase (adenine-specific)